MTRSLFDDPEPPAASRGGDDRRGGTPPPLAERMRPRSLDEVVGQQKVAGPEGMLRAVLRARRLPSLVLWGPPGTGKTTLARLLAAESGSRFVPFSAVTSGIREVKDVMADAARWYAHSGAPTLLFVDEIHRFNRAQQDAFLPYVESGEIVLVGASTENPSFELNAALLSRCRVVVLEPLGVDDLAVLLRRAREDAERGLGDNAVELAEEAVDEIAQLASGDARRALNLLESVLAEAQAQGREAIDRAAVRAHAQRKALVYDKSGEEHFNLISALHKSLRESDPDAALYWLARMLAAGEDPLYVARRMARFASEDVGLADPGALPRAIAAWDAFRRLGSPEGELALAALAVDLALAPKSAAVYHAWKKARRTVEERPAEPVPHALRNAPTKLMEEVGYGAGYVYAHDVEEGVGGLDCLPEGLRGETFYQPTRRGFEGELAERLERYRELREKVRQGRGE